MKKILLICMLLFAIVLSFAACGENDNPPSNNETPHTHSFGEWEVTVKPTCTKDGTKVRYCSCGEKQTEVVVSLGHSPAEAVIEDKVDATYEADGSYKEVVRCSTCKEKLSETSHTIPMLKHTPAEAVTENVIDATCYSEGSYDTVVYCSDCGAELERTAHTVEKVSHTPAEATEENRISATFESDGSYEMVVYCAIPSCHTEIERTKYTLDMLVHHPGDMVIENEIAATCYSEGSHDEVVYCLDDNCGYKELSRKTVILQKISHSPANAVVENRVEATCTVDGSYDEVVYCSVENCKAQISRTTKIIDALGHTEVIDEAVAPTCTSTGLTEGKHCSVCNEVLVAQTSVDALGHMEVIDEAVESTCAITGLTEGKHCSVCGEVLVAQQTIDALEHNYVDKICTVCGDKYYSKGLEYTQNSDGTCSLSGIGICTDTDIVIPSVSPSGDVVKRISSYAFEKCSFIKSIFIPETITNIENYAFLDCTSIDKVYINNIVSWCNIEFEYNMNARYGEYYYDCSANPLYYAKKLYIDGKHIQSLEIPSEITQIKAFAFYNADFTSVHIPSSIVGIGECAFLNCESLKGVYITDISAWCNINFEYQRKKYDTDYYYFCGANPLFYAKKLHLNNQYVRELVIPEGVTKIEAFAFDNGDFTSIHIPSTVSAIEAYAFNSNSSLTGVYITDLSAWCNIDFAYDRTTDEGVPYYESAFSNPLQFAKNLYFNDNQVTNLSLPGDITKIKPYVFYCANFSTVNISSSIKEIGYCAFASSQVKTVNFSNGLLYIYDRAFSYCTNITKLVLPDSLISVGKMSFSNCTNLADVTFGSALKCINYAAFGACDKITSVTFKITNGWRVDYEDILSETLKSSTLASTSTAANYIKSKYMIYTWTRN